MTEPYYYNQAALCGAGRVCVSSQEEYDKIVRKLRRKRAKLLSQYPYKDWASRCVNETKTKKKKKSSSKRRHNLAAAASAMDPGLDIIYPPGSAYDPVNMQLVPWNPDKHAIVPIDNSESDDDEPVEPVEIIEAPSKPKRTRKRITPVLISEPPKTKSKTKAKSKAKGNKKKKDKKEKKNQFYGYDYDPSWMSESSDPEEDERAMIELRKHLAAEREANRKAMKALLDKQK